MIIADITVQTSSITVALHDKLPLGAAGLKVRFHFSDPAWESLSKTAVFRNRNQTLDVALTEDWALIPHELLGKVMDVIDVGIYGTNGSQLLAIPAVWGAAGYCGKRGSAIRRSRNRPHPALLGANQGAGGSA